MDFSDLYQTLAAAAVRGDALRTWRPLPEELAVPSLEELTEEEITRILEIGKERGIKLYRFKRGHEDLPRVRVVMGYLRGLMPESLLDVGSGRGVFLFPFLDAFPDCAVTSLDLLDYRVAFLRDIHEGGVERLTALEQDLCTADIPEKSVDVVTLLEVLEHIPDVGRAVAAAVRIARRHVLVSVPSKPDNNPEHIHLLTRPVLTDLFHAAGCEKLHFSGVPGHLILTATVNDGFAEEGYA